MNFLILILLIVLISGLIASSGKKRIIHFKITHWFLIVYVGILTLATVIAPFLRDVPLEEKRVRNIQADKAHFDLYEKLRYGKLEQIDKEQIIKHETIENYQYDTLNIPTTIEGASIFIEKTDRQGNKIEVYTFNGTLIVDDWDFTSSLQSASFTLQEDRLKLQNTNQAIYLSIVNNGFPARQFTNERYMNHSIMSSNFIFYLKVPRSVDIIADDYPEIIYVAK
ncbi:hypothetical protein A8F94_12730 [Bacillus sp. FJAT-27225]|uniref:hypothetical protein n=1 Tax=Bacillus sp. FJAT-27225 TaxID=1743144 RepID=UPI00080C20AC|nr:hypothetical protein [Bacillus sp. FJAT-27225]OCA85733.1 hypothetical protein A8F94_12730 [Bacillus sp. FJAT-27225]